MSNLGDIQDETDGEIEELEGDELIYVMSDDDTDHVITTENFMLDELNSRYVPLKNEDQEVLETWDDSDVDEDVVVDVSSYLPSDNISFVNIRGFMKNESDNEASVVLRVSPQSYDYVEVLYGYDGGSSSANQAYSINEFQVELNSDQEFYYETEALADDVIDEGWLRLIGYWI